MQLDRADVVVVGGGTVGVTAAYFLARRGIDVVLLEQRHLAYGASGRNMGFLWMQTRNAGYSLELSRAGRSLYDEFEAEVGPNFEYRSNGGMIFFHTDSQRRVFEEFAASRREDGVDIEVLDAQAAREAAPILPEDIAGATYCAEDGQIRTPRFVRALGDACRRHGVRIHEGVTALGLLRDGDQVKGVQTAWGDVPADSVVWCAGVWARALEREGITIPIEPERLGAVLTGPVAEELDKVIYGPRAAKSYGMIRSLPSFREEDFAAPYEDLQSGTEHLEVMAKTEDGRLLLGCPLSYPGEIDDRMPMNGMKMTIDAFLETFPGYASLGIEGVWSGLLPNTADTLPIVDAVDELPGLFLSTGHVYGNVAGPISGKLLAEMVAGEETSLPVEELSLYRESLRETAGQVIRW